MTRERVIMPRAYAYQMLKRCQYYNDPKVLALRWVKRYTDIIKRTRTGTRKLKYNKQVSGIIASANWKF